jgi:hypothetical protein
MDNFGTDTILTLPSSKSIVYSSLAISPKGDPRVAFQYDGKLYYSSKNDDGTWDYELIDKATSGTFGDGVVLKIAKDNRPQVVYYKNGKLIYSIKEEGRWTPSTVESEIDLTPGTSGAGSFAFKLDIDRANLPRLCYFKNSTVILASKRSLRTKKSKTFVWSKTKPSSFGRDNVDVTGCAIEIDTKDRAHVAFYNSYKDVPDYYVEPNFIRYRLLNTSNQDSNTNDLVTDPVCMDSETYKFEKCSDSES